MAKKKKTKKHHPFRNAAPRAPRATTAKPEEETALKRLGYTAAGAADDRRSRARSSRTRAEASKTIATALAAVGAGLAWKGDAPTIRSIGAGVMSAAGSQLALMMMDDRDHKASGTTAQAAQAPVAKKPANAGELPPGSLENAFERAKTRLSISAGEFEMAG